MLRARRNTQGISTTEGWSRVPSELKKLLDSMCESLFDSNGPKMMLMIALDPEETLNPANQAGGHVCGSGQGDVSIG